MRPGMKMMLITSRNRESDNREDRMNYPRSYAPRSEIEYEIEHNRNEYNGSRVNNGVENRFRDRRGREHYDDGRFAPMRNEMEEMPDNFSRNNYPMHNMQPDSRNDRRYDNGRFAPTSNYRGAHEPEAYWPMTPGVRPIYEREAPEMNRIGFFQNERELNRDYTTNAGYAIGNEMEYRPGASRSGGHASTNQRPTLTKEMAEMWAAGMVNADGSKGPHWSMDQVKQFMQQKKIAEDPVKVWLAMNAEYSDRSKVNEKHGIHNMDFYLDSAMAFWLEDKDAVDDKLAAYYEHVVKH